MTEREKLVDKIYCMTEEERTELCEVLPAVFLLPGGQRMEAVNLYSEVRSFDQDFVSFLHYCAERLDQGDSVQAIWRDFQESGKQRAMSGLEAVS